MKWILASRSPRRIELLKNAGLHCKVKPADVDEAVLHGETPERMVKRLSRDKAICAFIDLEKKGNLGEVGIIAADTTVVHPNGRSVLGKPRTRAEAKKMIRAIQGKTHVVLTGFTIIVHTKKGSVYEGTQVVKTKVTMRKLSNSEVTTYACSGEGDDKAGAYAAQGIGMTLIESINGSYTNVVGLPVAEVLQAVKPWFNSKK